MKMYSRYRFGQNAQWRWVPRRLICHCDGCDAWSWLGLQLHFGHDEQRARRPVVIIVGGAR